MDSTLFSRRGFLATGAAWLAADVRAQAPADAIADYERATGGRVGLFARNAATGRQIAWRADERFAMCSTFKASLAALALARVDAGRERLDRAVKFGAADLLDYAPVAKAHAAAGAMTVEAMCQAVVELSDNTCANLLLRELGGPAALTQFWRGLGDGASRLDHDEPELNRNRSGELPDTTTPAAMAHTMLQLTTGPVLAPASRERLVGWLITCKTGLRKLRAGLPADWRAGDKTGSNGADAAGDLAVAWLPAGTPVVACAYVQGGKSSGAQQDELFSAIGRLVAGRLA
jgi:beta-lactamase class A